MQRQTVKGSFGEGVASECGWDQGEALASGVRFKRVPKNSVVKVNNIFVQ